MAVFRQRPCCLMCGERINGIYKDQSKTPFMQRIIGDTFKGWDYNSHKCNKKSEHYKKYLKDKKKYQNSKKGKETINLLTKISQKISYDRNSKHN